MKQNGQRAPGAAIPIPRKTGGQMKFFVQRSGLVAGAAAWMLA
jgi:hypothetical protein